MICDEVVGVTSSGSFSYGFTAYGFAASLRIETLALLNQRRAAFVRGSGQGRGSGQRRLQNRAWVRQVWRW